MFRTAVSLFVLAAFGIAMPATARAVEAEPQVQKITVTGAAGDLALGASRQYTATATYVGGGTGDVTTAVTWASSNTSVATVDSTGLAQSFNPGATVITASDGTVTSNQVRLVVSRCSVLGTAGPDVLEGTNGADLICGMGGDDTIRGHGGDDLLDGGAGIDTVQGGAGIDRLYGGTENDTVEGGSEGDFLYGDAGDDLVYGGTGADQLNGNAGADDLFGGDDADRIFGHAGADDIAGEAGNDRFFPGADDDRVDGGTGTNALDYSDVAGPIVADLAGNIVTGAGNDEVANIYEVLGTAAGDTLIAAASGSHLLGMTGTDTLLGGVGADLLKGGQNADSINAGGGNDSVFGDAGADTLSGDDGDDRVFGGVDGDSVGGGSGADALWGEGGEDTLSGGTENDVLNPGPNNDPTVDGGDGNDTVVYDGAPTNVTINLVTGSSSGAGIDALSNIENATGGQFNDTITGNGDANRFDGLGGVDTINAGGGADRVYGGIGNDDLDGEAGDDYLQGDAGADTVDGGTDNDYVDGRDGDDTVNGGDGGDSVVGGAGSDAMTGGDGNDTMNPGEASDLNIDGGPGTDALVYSNWITPGVTVDLQAGTSTGGGGNDSFVGIENVGGTQFDDTIFGDGGANFLTGKGGVDTIDGRGGTDIVNGGAGDDFLHGGGSDPDTVNGQDGTDTCGESVDTLLECELAFNVPPVLTLSKANGAYTEDTPATVVDDSLTLTDDGTELTGATVSIGSGFVASQDRLSFVNAAPITGTYNNATGVLTLTGTASVAAYQAALRTVRFENLSQDPNTGARTIGFTVTDGELADDAGNELSMAVRAVNDAPVADADSYSGGHQGVRMRVGTTHADTHEAELTGRVLDGDVDVDTPAANLTTTPGTITSTDCAVVCPGNVTMASDGTFTYDPPAGDDGTDSFTYTVEDNDTGDSDATEDTHTATVTLTRSGPRVWFVDDSAPAGGRGVSHAPLQSLAPLATGGAHETRDGSGDRVFLYSGTYTSGLDLETNQMLIGQPNGLNVGGTQYVAAGGTRPAISAASGHVVTLASGTEVQDLALGDSHPASYSLFAPAGAGAYTVADTDVNNAGGGGLNLADGTPNVALGTLSSNNSGGNGVRITDTDGGSVSATTGALQNAANATVHVANAASSLSLGSSISDDVGQLVSISGGTGANTFNGTVSDGVDGDGNGISISSAGGLVNFTNAVTLSTGPANALTATNSTGGLRMVPTSGVNTLATTEGAALTVTNTPIHQNGLTFRSISATDPAKNALTYGIHLDSTGTTGTHGTLTVTGNGAASTGGTITGKSTGIRLLNTKSPSFSWMKLHDHSDFAIYGNSVQSFQMDRTVIDGQGGTQNGDDPNTNEGAVSFDNLTGTGASITNSTIAQGVSNDLRVVNTSGTLNRLTVDNTTFNNTLATHNDGIQLEAMNSSVLNATIRNSTFQGARGDHIDMNAIQSSTSDLVVQSNTLSNAHPSSLGGSINADSSGTADLTYLVDNNTINGAKGTAIFVGKQFGGAPADGTAVGTINNNRVGTSGVASSGSLNGSGIEVSTLARGKHSAVVSNNTVRQYRDNGINLFIGGSPTSTTLLPAHDAAVNYTVTGNTVSNPGPNGALAGGGIFLNAGTNSPDAYQVCLNMQNNQLSGSQPLGGGSRDLWLRQRFNSVVRMPAYTGAEHNGGGTLSTDMTNYLTGRGNTLSTIGVSTQDSVNGGGGFFNTVGSAPCPTS